MSSSELDIPGELGAANQRLPIDMSQVNMPLDITIRSVALSIAQRHCGDTTVKEGNLYQQLKMDNKLAGPLTTEHVIRAALIFEMYICGQVVPRHRWEGDGADDGRTQSSHQGGSI